LKAPSHHVFVQPLAYPSAIVTQLFYEISSTNPLHQDPDQFANLGKQPDGASCCTMQEAVQHVTVRHFSEAKLWTSAVPFSVIRLDIVTRDASSPRTFPFCTAQACCHDAHVHILGLACPVIHHPFPSPFAMLCTIPGSACKAYLLFTSPRMRVNSVWISRAIHTLLTRMREVVSKRVFPFAPRVA
jgi:hypothetical protein